MDATEHLKGMAYHEAGHAGVAWALGLPVGDVYVRYQCPAYRNVNKAGALDWRRHMRSIVDEAGEIIAIATDDHTLIGGHHRLAVAASLGQKTVLERYRRTCEA